MNAIGMNEATGPKMSLVESKQRSRYEDLIVNQKIQTDTKLIEGACLKKCSTNFVTAMIFDSTACIKSYMTIELSLSVHQSGTPGQS